MACADALIPSRSSFSTSPARGREVVLVRNRCGMPRSRIQSIAELAYGFIYKMVEDVTGKDGVKYFPYIMTLFVFIVFSNFLGLLPLSFTTTSHIAVTAVMAMAVFLAVTILGFVKNGMGFLGVFWIKVLDEFRRVFDVGKADGNLVPFTFEGTTRSQDFFCQVCWGVRNG